MSMSEPRRLLSAAPGRRRAQQRGSAVMQSPTGDASHTPSPLDPTIAPLALMPTGTPQWCVFAHCREPITAHAPRWERPPPPDGKPTPARPLRLSSHCLTVPILAIYMVSPLTVVWGQWLWVRISSSPLDDMERRLFVNSNRPYRTGAVEMPQPGSMARRRYVSHPVGRVMCDA